MDNLDEIFGTVPNLDDYERLVPEVLLYDRSIETVSS
jgi:hypothetical protein